MIKSKHAAQINLGPQIPFIDGMTISNDPDPQERPGSAPVTREESANAQQHAGKFGGISREELEDLKIMDASDIMPSDSEEIQKMRRSIMEDILREEIEEEEEENEEETQSQGSDDNEGTVDGDNDDFESDSVMDDDDSKPIYTY